MDYLYGLISGLAVWLLVASTARDPDKSKAHRHALRKAYLRGLQRGREGFSG